MLLEAQLGLSLLLSPGLNLGSTAGVKAPLTPINQVKAKAQTRVLESLISDVLASHPSQNSQAFLTQSAQSGVESAKWQFYPTPSVVVEKSNANAADSANPANSTTATLRLQQPLWTGGRLTAGLQKAEANVGVNLATLEDTRQQLALRVVQGYGDWLGAHLKIIANEKSMVTHVRLRAQVKQRVLQGIATDSDLVQALARLEALASDIAVVRAQQDIALGRLGQLLGRPVAASSLSASLVAPLPVRFGLPKLLEQASTINPGIQKAQAQAQVQESLIAERRSDLYPEVYLRAEQQYGNYAYRSSSSDSQLSIGLSSHFGAGLSSRSGVDVAQAQHQAALEEVNTQLRNVNEQVQADHALATSSQARLTALRASLKAAQEVSNSYDRQFLAGRKTWLDVMNAARELVQTETQLADIESTQLIVTWRLAINTQGLNAVLSGQP